MVRSLAETIPPVTVGSAPRSSALPIATTESPTFNASELPSGSGTRSSRSMRSTARSARGSAATNSAFSVVPSPRVTEIDSEPSTTWALVATKPVGRHHPPGAGRLADKLASVHVGLHDGGVNRHDRRACLYYQSMQAGGTGGECDRSRIAVGGRAFVAVVANTIDQGDRTDDNPRSDEARQHTGNEPASVGAQPLRASCVERRWRRAVGRLVEARGCRQDSLIRHEAGRRIVVVVDVLSSLLSTLTLFRPSSA